MLRHSLATLEGSKILWHIVAPPLPSTPLFVSLSNYNSPFFLVIFPVAGVPAFDTMGHLTTTAGFITHLYVLHFLKKGCGFL